MTAGQFNRRAGRYNRYTTNLQYHLRHTTAQFAKRPNSAPAAHDRQDAASHTCRPRRYPGVLARLRTGSPSGSYRSATPPALPGTVSLY